MSNDTEENVDIGAFKLLNIENLIACERERNGDEERKWKGKLM